MDAGLDMGVIIDTAQLIKQHEDFIRGDDKTIAIFKLMLFRRITEKSQQSMPLNRQPIVPQIKKINETVNQICGNSEWPQLIRFTRNNKIRWLGLSYGKTKLNSDKTLDEILAELQSISPPQATKSSLLEAN